MRIHYNPGLKELARKLRRNSTLAEIILWDHLKGKRMLGYDFHRQKPVEEYIVDFFCPKLKLIVGIDGITHHERLDKDALRQQHLEKLGFTVLRFFENDVRSNLGGVLEAIKAWIEIRKSRDDTPLNPLLVEGTAKAKNHI